MAFFFFRLFKNRIFLTFCALPQGTAPRPGGSFGGLAAGFSKSCVCLSSASFAFLRHSGRNPSSFFCVWISSLSLFFLFSFVCRTSGIFYFCRCSSSPCARFSSLPLFSFVSPVCRYFFIFSLKKTNYHYFQSFFNVVWRRGQLVLKSTSLLSQLTCTSSFPTSASVMPRPFQFRNLT